MVVGQVMFPNLSFHSGSRVNLVTKYIFYTVGIIVTRSYNTVAISGKKKNNSC